MFVIASYQVSTSPSWTCFIDGNALISDQFPAGPGGGERICWLQNIVNKTTPSNLTVVASGTNDSPFLFDRIEYIPDASVNLGNATVVVNAYDDQIHYDSGWKNLAGVGMETSVLGASMTFDFVGALRL